MSQVSQDEDAGAFDSETVVEEQFSTHFVCAKLCTVVCGKLYTCFFPTLFEVNCWGAFLFLHGQLLTGFAFVKTLIAGP